MIYHFHICPAITSLHVIADTSGAAILSVPMHKVVQLISFDGKQVRSLRSSTSAVLISQTQTRLHVVHKLLFEGKSKIKVTKIELLVSHVTSSLLHTFVMFLYILWSNDTISLSCQKIHRAIYQIIMCCHIQRLVLTIVTSIQGARFIVKHTKASCPHPLQSNKQEIGFLHSCWETCCLVNHYGCLTIRTQRY